jgi:hypothetical protein
MDVALGVTEARGKTADTLAVDHPVSDQAHGTPHKVGAKIPVGRAGRGVGATALTRAKASGLCGCSGSEEAHVLAFGRARWAAWTTIDPGRLDPAEDPPVEARIGRLDGVPDAL